LLRRKNLRFAAKKKSIEDKHCSDTVHYNVDL
jgi:hypothetical protein